MSEEKEVYQSADITELAKALVMLQSKLEHVGRSEENPYHHSRYAPLPDCWDVLRPLLAEGQLCVTQTGRPSSPDTILLETQITHAPSGQWKRGIMTFATITYGKDGRVLPPNPQASKSAITYARRTGLEAITGLCEAQDDDDAELAMQRHETTPAQQFARHAPAAPLSPPTATGLTPTCPECAGQMVDNRKRHREDKAAGKRYPAPAWRCANYKHLCECGKGFFPFVKQPDNTWKPATECPDCNSAVPGPKVLSGCLILATFSPPIA